MVRAALAVAIHDVEPATFARCVHMRAWLAERGVDRVTLLVIPAADLHPFFQRSPTLAQWLRERCARGDAVAQHGLHHRQLRPARGPRQLVAHWQGGRAAEFCGLDSAETRMRVADGRHLLALAGLQPRGFVAPAYAYNLALRRELKTSFAWHATLLRVRGARGAGPAFGLGTSTAFKRRMSPLVLRTASWLSVSTLRVDLHPADWDHPEHLRSLEDVLAREAHRRRAVTYDDLADRALRRPASDAGATLAKGPATRRA